MNSTLMKLISDSDSRYLTHDEQQQILSYTNSLTERFRAADAVAQKEETIVRQTIEQVKRCHPNLDRMFANAWDRCFRDVQLVLRYTVQAMVCDDPSVLTDKLLYWMRTILASSQLSPQLTRDTYTALRDSVRQHTPAAFGLLEPLLKLNIDVLSDLPEPAVALA